MGVRDALLLNTTGSNFEALQSNDTARIKGDFSIKNTSNVEIFGVDVSTGNVTVAANISSSGNITGSATSTGSFGRVVATTFHGDGIHLRDTLTRSPGLVTGSAQIAADISGAFDAGFFFGFQASSSISGGIGISASFGRLQGNEFHGDGSGMASTLPRSAGILSSSAQIASDISGSFNKGFEYTGIIKGGPVTAGGTWSAGGALASSISYHGAAGNKCGQIVAMGVSGNNSLGSLDATRTFEYNGSSWSEAGDNNTNRARAAGAGTVNSGLFFGGYAPNWYGTSQGATETYNGTNFSEVNNMIMPRRAHMGAGLSSEAALALGGYTDSAPVNPGFNPNMGKFTEVWNGTNWSESGDAPANMKRGGMAGSVNAAVMFGSNTDPDLTLHWDGSTWSEGGSGHAPNGIDATHGGTQNDAIRGTTGYVSPNVYTPATQYYNGSTWSEGPNMINAYAHRGMGHNQGSAANSLAAGGEGGPVSGFGGQTATEEHTGGNAVISGSFGKLDATTLVGDATGLQSTLPYSTGLITGSAQIAADISQSFNKGFEFVGSISGSATSTGSFGRLVATKFAGNASQMTDLPFNAGMVSGSAQLSADISGSFNKGFGYQGRISGSAQSTGSFGRVVVDGAFQGDFSAIDANEDGFISSSKQLAADISASIRGDLIFGTPYETGSFFIGVSGSKFGHVPDSTLVTGAETTMSISSLCGSDFDPRLQFERGWTNTNYFGGFKSIRTGKADQYVSRTGGGFGVWSQGGALPQVKTNGFSMGTAHAALSVGGYTPTNSDITNKYDGTVWAASAKLAEVRVTGGSAGTQNAALIFGGRVTHPAESNTDRTEQYNGSTWSEVNNMSVAANGVGGLGTQNAALVAGPMGSPAAAQAEDWNGDVWSEAASNNVNRSQFGMGGTYYGGMMVTGYSPNRTCSELWNGSTWSVTSAIPSGTMATSFAGTSNAGIFYGNHAQTGLGKGDWDGNSWKTGATMTVPSGYMGKTEPGVSSCAIFIGGQGAANAPGNVPLACTQHYEISTRNTGSFHAITANKYSGIGGREICLSGVTFTFADGASCTLSTLADDISGSFNNGFEFSGNISGSANSTGSLSKFKADTVVTHDMTVGSFTNTNLMPYQSSSFRSHTNKSHIIPYVGDDYYDTRRYVPTGSQLYSCGSCTDFSNGYDNANGQLSIGRDGILNISFITASATDDGLGKTAGAWSAGPNLITATRPNMFGTANAAVTTGGSTGEAENSGVIADVQHYNGISFRQGQAIPVSAPQGYGAAAGGQGYGQSENDLALLRGYVNGNLIEHLQYNGHSWYDMTKNTIVGRCHGAFGSQNAAVMAGGEGTPSTKAEEWNGHSWSAAGDPIANRGASGAGTQNAGIIGSGTCNNSVQTYDGTTFSAASNAGAYSGASGQSHLSGTQNDAIGSGTSTQATWDGTSWATIVDKPEDRHQAGLAGGSGVAFLAGGGPNPGSSIATTLEWNNSFNTGSFLTTKKIGSNFS